MKLFKSEDFNKWVRAQPQKIKAQIDARLLKIETGKYFGLHKKLNEHLSELKFNNGNRIYYTIKKIDEEIVFIILGGNKNGQQKDIDKATKVAEKIHSEKA